jgi:hypothetical protein
MDGDDTMKEGMAMMESNVMFVLYCRLLLALPFDRISTEYRNE